MVDHIDWFMTIAYTRNQNEFKRGIFSPKTKSLNSYAFCTLSFLSPIIYTSFVCLCSGPTEFKNMVMDMGIQQNKTLRSHFPFPLARPFTWLRPSSSLFQNTVTASISLPDSSLVLFLFIFSAAIIVIVSVLCFLKHMHLILRFPYLKLFLVILSCLEDKMKHKPLHMVLPLILLLSPP